MSENTHIISVVILRRTLSGASLPRCDRSRRSRCRSEEFEMDVAEVSACSWEDRNYGELEESVRGNYKAAFVLTVCLF